MSTNNGSLFIHLAYANAKYIGQYTDLDTRVSRLQLRNLRTRRP